MSKKYSYSCQCCGKRVYEIDANHCHGCRAIVCSACVVPFGHVPLGVHRAPLTSVRKRVKGSG